MLYSEAVAVVFDRTLHDGTRVYKGTLDPFWAVGAVPHGGYVLGCILEAVMHSQSSTGQPDPVHISSHFLIASVPETYEIRLRQLRVGRRFSNLTADFVQHGQVNVISHIIVGTLPDPVASMSMAMSSDPSSPTIISPHPFGTRTPFRQHPSIAEIRTLPKKLTFRSQLKRSIDRIVQETYLAKANNPRESNGGFDVGEWYEILGEEKGHTFSLSAIAFLADMGRNSPGILPKNIRPGTSWFPTLTMALEFKVKLSSLPPGTASRTFGVFSTGRFIHQGRHDSQTEIWTAPCGIGEKVEPDSDDEGWRDKMFCVAIASQMALTIPLEVNIRKGKGALTSGGGGPKL